eukprot:gene2674-5566_t
MEHYLKKRVAVVTQDGRFIVGNLRGFDQAVNLILTDSSERVVSLHEGVEVMSLGLYIVRGDNVLSAIAVTVQSALHMPFFNGATRIFFFPNETVMFSRAMIAELDVEHDESIDLATVHAEPVPPVVY